MNRRKKLVNRRKNHRFNVKNNIFAVLKPQYTQMGKLIDINTTGLAFQYIDCIEDIHTYTKPSELAIFLNKGNVYLDFIPVKTTYAYEIENDLFYNSTKIMRVSVQFSELVFDQLIQLEYFILNHTRETLEDRRANQDRRSKQRIFYETTDYKHFEMEKRKEASQGYNRL